jgi:hypothetical protein
MAKMMKSKETVTLPMLNMIFEETKWRIVELNLAKSNWADEPMIDKKYNIEKAEQDIIKHTIEYFTEKDIS